MTPRQPMVPKQQQPIQVGSSLNLPMPTTPGLGVATPRMVSAPPPRPQSMQAPVGAPRTAREAYAAMAPAPVQVQVGMVVPQVQTAPSQYAAPATYAAPAPAVVPQAVYNPQVQIGTVVPQSQSTPS